MGDRRDRFVVLSTDLLMQMALSMRLDQTYAISGGLEGIKLPEADASGGGALPMSISIICSNIQSGTGAYLSSEGMVFHQSHGKRNRARTLQSG